MPKKSKQQGSLWNYADTVPVHQAKSSLSLWMTLTITFKLPKSSLKLVLKCITTLVANILEKIISNVRLSYLKNTTLMKYTFKLQSSNALLTAQMHNLMEFTGENWLSLLLTRFLWWMLYQLTKTSVSMWMRQSVLDSVKWMKVYLSLNRTLKLNSQLLICLKKVSFPT